MLSGATLANPRTPFYGNGPTPPPTPTPPSSAPTIPSLVSVTDTSITISFSIAGITGNPTPTYSILYGLTPSLLTTPAPAFQFLGNTYRATVTGLTPETYYYFSSVAQNTEDTRISDVSDGYLTNATPPPPAPLNTYAVATFLINGPIFNTPYTTALNYYLSCDAVGGTLNSNGSVTGTQDFGSYYAKTAGTIPEAFSPPGPWDGLCFSDIDSTDNATASAFYLTPLSTSSSKVLVSFGGYYADVRGLFSTPSYSIPSYPGGSQPTATQVMQSYCATFYNGTSAPNPLSWSNSGWAGVRFDGLNLDFENIGQGGNPGASNTYPPLPSTPPTFPASASDPQYSSYIQAMVDVIQTHHLYAPTKILTHAPLSLAINGDGSTTNCAITTALNTWFAFANSTTAPNTTSYNNTTSLAMNHPNQLKYFDDVFIQCYNAVSDNYVGGANFPTILAQWGYVALVAQGLGIKTPKINIGLAKGVIQGSTANPSVPNSQGVTAPLPGSLPSTYWYPQWQTASPPNPSATLPVGFTFPNIGIDTDATNLINALNSANDLLKISGLPNAASIKISDWCSGGGFWAGGPATANITNLFNDVTNLPQINTYLWSDAMYPAPSPNWPGNVPVVL